MGKLARTVFNGESSKMFRALTSRVVCAVSTATRSQGSRCIATSQICLSGPDPDFQHPVVPTYKKFGHGHGKPDDPAAWDAAYIKELENPDIDGWQVRQIMNEVQPTLTELGISNLEEMGYDKPELAAENVED